MNIISKYDFLCFTETWTTKHFTIDIPGFKCIHISGKKKSEFSCGRPSGGISLYYKETFEGGVTVLEQNSDGLLWFKLDKEFFGVEEDLYFCLLYIPPMNSPVYKRKSIDFFEELEYGIVKYKHLGKLYILGDLNSRVGLLEDTIVNTNFDYIPNIDDDFFDEYVPRCSADKGVNAFGHRLINLCKSTGMLIGNGRLGCDVQQGKCTYYASQGQSLIDYLLLSTNALNDVVDFQILDPNEFSHHSPLYMSLYTNVKVPKPKRYTYENKLIWDETKIDVFTESIVDILPAINDMFVFDGNHVNNESVNMCVENFCDMIYDKAYKCFGKRVPCCSTSYSKPKNTWFNNECKTERCKFNKIRNEYLRYPDDTKKSLYFKQRAKYNNVRRKNKCKFNISQGIRLCNEAKSNPKSFWKTFKNVKKGNSSNSKLETDDFYRHFKNLFDVDSVDKQFENINSNVDVDVLDGVISLEELEEAVCKLKKGKSPGLDGLIPEIYISICEIIKSPVLRLFNFIFEHGLYPKSWAEYMLVPVPKKGNLDDTNNFRGIVLMSILGKLFSLIMYNRLLNWSKLNDIFIENQFGFLPNRSTVDCLFILHALISKALNDGQKVHCAFIDFRKAFDKIERNILWCKLVNYGISSKMLSILKAMYVNVRLCVKYRASCSDFFECNAGVKQGEPLSPLLFLFFINDINESLDATEDTSLFFNEFNIFSLLFADDTVLFANSDVELQNLLNRLNVYCKKNYIEVNIEKTKIMVFRKCKRFNHNNLVYDGKILENVNSFVYLGVTLLYNGKWNVTQKSICGLGSKAMYSLLNMLDKWSLTAKLKLKLFDSMVSSILNYGCEVWGFHPGDCIDKLHLKFCKLILGVKRSTNNNAVLGELARFPFYISRQFRIIKYWIKILSVNNNLLFKSYNVLRCDADLGFTYNGSNWAHNVKKLLFSLGLNDIWINQDTVVPNFNIIKQRIIDQYLQKWSSSMKDSTRLDYCNIFKNEHVYEKYLDVIKETHLRSTLSKFRLSSHLLNIETGRHDNIDRGQRICKCCNMKNIESEYHFLLVCPLYSSLRKKHLSNYYCHWPNIQKFCTLMSTTNNKTMYKLSKFLYSAFKLRDNYLNIK